MSRQTLRDELRELVPPPARPTREQWHQLTEAANRRSDRKRSNWYAGVLAAAAAVAVLVLFGVVLGRRGSVVPTAVGTRNPGPVVWTGARTASADMQLLVSYEGGEDVPPDSPCYSTAKPEVRETDDSVTVTLLYSIKGLETGATAPCHDVAVQRTTTVQLSRPLGNRVVFDGKDNTQRPVFPESLLFMPSAGDAKAGLSSEYAESLSPSDTPTAGAQYWKRIFQIGSGDKLTVEQGHQTLKPDTRDPVTPTPIRGTTGSLYVKTIGDTWTRASVRWSEAGQELTVILDQQGHDPQTAQAELIRIVEGLTAPAEQPAPPSTVEVPHGPTTTPPVPSSAVRVK